jgi:Type II CAAX prenyl endopeptidase Rce1-like
MLATRGRIEGSPQVSARDSATLSPARSQRFDVSGASGGAQRASVRAEPEAAVTVVVIAVVIGFLYDYAFPAHWWVDRLPIPVSVIPSIALLVVLARRNGRPVDPTSPLADFLDMRLGAWRRWREYYVVMTVGLVVAAMYYARIMGSSTEPWALLANALVEEAQFRYSIPIVIAAAALIVGVGRTAAVAIGLGISSVMFAAMPGHLEQMTTWLDIAPFLAFAVLTSMVAVRTRSLLPCVLSHTLVNICTLPVSLSIAPPAVRLAGVVVGLIGLVVSAEIANQRRAAEGQTPDRLGTDRHLAVLSAIDLDLLPTIDLDFESSAATIFDPGTDPDTHPDIDPGIDPGTAPGTASRPDGRVGSRP